MYTKSFTFQGKTVSRTAPRWKCRTMRLKALEISGFKSFKDKTVIHFSEGISAIVGPNGCGKSNIVDAIRWVMGEQRLSILRGKKMEDLVFNGSEDTHALGMAEVAITMNNNGMTFPDKYAQCTEVRIARRVYRDGETEYTINKAPCRLLDIREFFMDAGVSTRTYSIIEQERISRLVEAKPEDRRQFIEEAAGIAKYKSRKDSAVRKMESTNQNILRLKDIIAEVKSHLTATSRQAKRAEQYKELKKEIKEAHLTLALQGYTGLREKKGTLLSAQEDLRQRLTAAETGVAHFDSEIEKLRVDLADEESIIAALQEKFYAIGNDITRKEEEIKFSRERTDNLARKKESDSKEIAELENRTAQFAEEAASLKRRNEERIAERDRLSDKITEKDTHVDMLRETVDTVSRERDEEKARYMDAVAELSRLKNFRQSLLKGIDDIAKKKEREADEKSHLTERREALEKSQSSLAAQLESARTRNASLKEQGAITREELEEKRAERTDIVAVIDELKDDISRSSSRLSSLKELQEQHDLCDEGPRAVLQNRSILQENSGVFTLVADCISVSKEYEAAVEAVLAEKLQYVIVSDHRDCRRAIDYLKTSGSGRATLMPLNAKAQQSQGEPITADDGSPRRLADIVTVTRPETENSVAALLSDAYLVPDMEKGLTLWRKNGFRGILVTPDGDIIHPHGALTGGRGIKSETSILGNNREIAEREAEIEDKTRRLSEKKDTLAALDGEVSHLSDTLDELRTEYHESELAMNGIQKDLERAEGEITWTDERLNVHAYNEETLESEEKSAREQIAETEAQMNAHDEAIAARQEQIDYLQEHLNTVTAELKAEENTLTDKKIILTSLNEKINGTTETLTRLERNRGDIERQIDMTRRAMETAEQQSRDIVAETKRGTAALEEMYLSHEEAEKGLSEKRNAHQTSEQALRDAEAKGHEAKKKHDALMKDFNTNDINLRELDLKIDTLKSGIYDKFYCDLDDLLPSYETIDRDEADRLAKKLEKNKKRIDDFGEVNLLALSEYEQFKERYDFLVSQRDDLNKSLATLQRTISRINRITRKRFSQTFEAVNASFQEVFPRLFPGGKGTLRLTDESNLLETGVDIDIQVPGKKRQNISLLSGGEKALSAIALIFAIMTYRPTPFLILDEADAPLDDSNVSRFKNLVSDLAHNSQIICITHNKRTMESADNLIGVTMEKNGISSLVSVSLN